MFVVEYFCKVAKTKYFCILVKLQAPKTWICQFIKGDLPLL